MLGAAAAVDAESARRKVLTRCGECRGCQGEDCGQCANCADKPKFGGAGAPYFPVTDDRTQLWAGVGRARGLTRAFGGV